ncbi:Fur family transcriptional regulator [Microvirga sp. VF16]|uniref:Fur family transcriptional regulator n=1 Tax=Microvirga sp. VF16 TaxID=2807101 RepID=UPI00193E3D2B|nr:Fur family transcriptional regulator [Microvirga sp. VF16]QRM33210.1 transcriptional repressor [Microvirga sp. VF16]
MNFAKTDGEVAPSALNRTQQRVHRILTEAKRPLTAYAILGQLRGQTQATPPTVYRSLAKLIRHGLVHRIESLNAYVACPGHHVSGAVAFAICSHCGSVTEFTDSRISYRLQAWSRSHAFRLQDTAVELKGLCASCAT